MIWVVLSLFQDIAHVPASSSAKARVKRRISQFTGTKLNANRLKQN